MNRLFYVLLAGGIFFLSGTSAGGPDYPDYYGLPGKHHFYPHPAPPTRYCYNEPEPHYALLPPECYPHVIDVGTCHKSTCRRCHGQRFCCTPVLFAKEYADCNGRSIAVESITRCECKPCEEPWVVITGKIIDSSGEPLNHVEVLIDGEEVSTTDVMGQFGFHILPPEDGRLVLNFVDATDPKPLRFMPVTKVLRIGDSPQSLSICITLPKIGTMPFSSADDFTRNVDASGSISSYTLHIPGGSYVDEDGLPYSGMVSLYMISFDTSREDVPMGPTELFADGERMMASSGMFRVLLRAADGSPLRTAAAQLSVDFGALPPELHESLMLWRQNKETGYFESEGGFEIPGKKRGSPIGTIDLEDLEPLRNLDIVLPYYCYVKVGVYDDCDLADEIVGASVSAIYFTTPGAPLWSGFITAVTQPSTGACVPIPCNSLYSPAIYVGLTASYLTEDLKAAEVNKTAVAGELIEVLEYRRSDEMYEFFITLPKEDFDFGPIYTSEICQQIPLEQSMHFVFYRDGPPARQFNTIPIDLNNFFASWRFTDLAWWPSDSLFCACFIKIQFGDISGILDVRAYSSNVDGELYGIRQEPVVDTEVCLEYRCSLMNDRTVVTIGAENPDDDFGLVEVNAALESYLDANPPSPSNPLGSTSFEFYAPVAPEMEFGIYKAQADDHPLAAIANARSRCMDGAAVAIVVNGKPGPA